MFLVGQVVNGGMMNSMIDDGYYEINPFYGSHPTKEQVWIGKAIGTAAVWVASEKIAPKYKDHILSFANGVVWGLVYYDTQNCGISCRVEF